MEFSASWNSAIAISVLIVSADLLRARNGCFASFLVAFGEIAGAGPLRLFLGDLLPFDGDFGDDASGEDRLFSSRVSRH